MVKQQVAGLGVTVEPQRGPIPCRRKRCSPDLRCQLGVDAAPERGQGLLGLAVINGQRAAAEEVVLPWPWPASRVDLVQGGQEVRQVGRELRHVSNRFPVSHGIAVDPLVHRPRPRETAPGFARSQQHRDGQRQLPGQHWQPALLLLDRFDVVLRTRQPDGHRVTKPERGIVPAVDVNRADGQASPRRELARHQPRNQASCDIRLTHRGIVAPPAVIEPRNNDRDSGGPVERKARHRYRRGVTRRGWSVDQDVGHRRFLDHAPDLRPLPDGTLFDRIGGQATVDRLVDSLYDRFEADAVLRPFFGRHLVNGRDRQKRFFAEWLGGPPRYSESAWGSLYRHHEDLPITGAVAERWLGYLRGALSDAVPAGSDAADILERARAIALALVNSEEEPAGRTPGASRHRSQRIASCGVGARTVKQAALLAERGKVDELATLVAEIPDAVERAPFAARLLQSATLAGRVEVVEWLLDHGADANSPAPLPVRVIGGALELVFFVTPLCATRMTRRQEISALLLRRGAKEDVFTAAFLGDLPLVRRLLSERASLAQIPDPATDVLTITPIHHAVAGSQLPILRTLLDHTDEPVQTGSRALRAAAERGSAEMIELLLEHGADARAVGAGWWVLDRQIAPLLANAGASAGVGIDGEDSGDWVRISCTGNKGRKDNPAYVAALLRHGARVDQRYNGATPLHYVVKAGFVHTIRVLLEHGADADALDDRGRTPLDWLGQAAKTVDRDTVRDALRAASRG